MVVRNEMMRIRYFLDYYRNIGCEHFIIIDNDSSDGTAEYLRDQDDVSSFRSTGSYARSRYGNDWVNLILGRYCIGKWVLYVDADELLVFPHCGSGSLKRLVHYLDTHGERSMRCLMIDMYSNFRSQDAFVSSGQDPLEVCSFFDSYGYYSQYDKGSNTEWVKGGVRGRKFFTTDLWAGPALNKTPLVKWRRGYCFLKSSHQLWPLKLNMGCNSGPSYVSGGLLHFKFTSSGLTKIGEEASRRQHTTEYERYSDASLTNDLLFSQDLSIRYLGWKTLYDLGLIQGLGWFDAQTSRPTQG